MIEPKQSIHGHARARAGGFTLTELLIVIAIVILLLTLAVPAFSVITGGRSIESAQNQLAAIVGRARAEAIGQQRGAALSFFRMSATAVEPA